MTEGRYMGKPGRRCLSVAPTRGRASGPRCRLFEGHTNRHKFWSSVSGYVEQWDREEG